MAISSLGVGSGYDLSGIVDKMMQVEQQPLIKLTTKEASYQSKISALGSLQGAVSTLNSAFASLQVSSAQTATTKFSSFSASVTDTTIASATASTSATAGSYTLEVNRLATAHRLTTIARAHELTSASFASETSSVAAADATLSIKVDGSTTDIAVTAGTTLSQLVTKINNAGAGATAAIEDNGVGGKVLVLTSDTAGTAGTMNLTGLSGFIYDADTTTYELTQSQAAEGGYTSTSASIASGTLELTVGDGTAHQITIDSSNNTLKGLRDAINSAKAGVTATLSTVSAHDVRLVITSNTTGSGGQIKLSGLTGFAFNPDTGSGDLSQTEADGGQVAQNAKIKLNGTTINAASNTVKDAIQGVTLSLTKVTTTATSLTVTQDKSSTLTTAFTNIAKAYNDLNSTVESLGGYDAETKTGGPLLGNSTLRSVSFAVRNLFQSAVGDASNSSYKRLSDLGLEIQKDGTIVFNSAKLSSATTSDFETVANLAATFGKTADTLTDGMLGTKGSITAATDGAKASVKSIGKQRVVLSERLVQIEARYKRQFSALDSLIASMNTTSSYLTRQLANLPGASSSS